MIYVMYVEKMKFTSISLLSKDRRQDLKDRNVKGLKGEGWGLSILTAISTVLLLLYHRFSSCSYMYSLGVKGEIMLWTLRRILSSLLLMYWKK